MNFRSLSSICAIAVISVSSLLVIGCASTFLVSKDCYSAFLDSNDEKMVRMLCDTGDFRHIVDTTELSSGDRESLYEALCEKHSGEEVKKIYASFTSQQQKDLKLSFEKHGYDINYKPVEASGAARIGGLRENLRCPAQGPGF